MSAETAKAVAEYMHALVKLRDNPPSVETQDADWHIEQAQCAMDEAISDIAEALKGENAS